jgi:hypothetical protein
VQEVVMDQLYACRYGTFLFNSEAERVASSLPALTVSLWTHMLSRIDLYRNVHYKPRHGALSAPVLLRQLQVWPYHHKWRREMKVVERADSKCLDRRNKMQRVEEENRELQRCLRALETSDARSVPTEGGVEGGDDEGEGAYSRNSTTDGGGVEETGGEVEGEGEGEDGYFEEEHYPQRESEREVVGGFQFVGLQRNVPEAVFAGIDEADDELDEDE